MEKFEIIGNVTTLRELFNPSFKFAAFRTKYSYWLKWINNDDSEFIINSDLGGVHTRVVIKQVAPNNFEVYSYSGVVHIEKEATNIFTVVNLVDIINDVKNELE